LGNVWNKFGNGGGLRANQVNRVNKFFSWDTLQTWRIAKLVREVLDNRIRVYFVFLIAQFVVCVVVAHSLMTKQNVKNIQNVTKRRRSRRKKI
jgi:hypothetical protein